MKKSFYNFVFYQNNGKHILYNSRTGAMAELDDEHVEQLERWSEQEIEEKNPEFASALVQNGFAIADDVSELDMIRYDSLRARYGNRNLALTIIPTQDCNFKCPYCCEKGVMHAIYMNDEIKEALIEYVEENLMPEANLSVFWYGGEPLMALDLVEDLTKRMEIICKKKNAKYSAGMVTNGYLLNKKTTEKLLDCKVDVLQITLDGNRNSHDLRRHMADGTPTFDVIWNNILSLKEYAGKIKVKLRVNVDKNNPDAAKQVATMVHASALTEFVWVAPEKVMNFDGCYHQELCYEDKEFAILEQDYYIENECYLSRCYPEPQINYCCADCTNAIVVDADGFIYKCWLDAGHHNLAVGNIKNIKCENEERLYQYLLYDPTLDEVCSRCKYMPICWGGCPRERMQGRRQCTQLKENFEKYMEYLPRVMEKKQ